MTSALRRFAQPGPATPEAPDRERPAERCEMCAAVLDERHSHVVDTEQRSLVCTCRACWLLFTARGAGRGRYLAVPDDVHHDPDAGLSEQDWDELRVPVGTAFFFVNSQLGRVVGCYPSPGGATESELDLAAWEGLARRYPMIGALAPDVQALVVLPGDHGIESYLAPIDVCYELVGRIRLRWRGLDGGDEVRATLAAFRDDLRARSTPWRGRG